MIDKSLFALCPEDKKRLSWERRVLNAKAKQIKTHLTIRNLDEMYSFLFNRPSLYKKAESLAVKIEKQASLPRDRFVDLVEVALLTFVNGCETKHRVSAKMMHTPAGRRTLNSLRENFNASLPELSAALSEGHTASHSVTITQAQLKASL